MKNNRIKVKQVGNFVLTYLGPKEISLSWKGMFSGISTQLLTHEKVDSVLTPTGTYFNLPFEGRLYPGINFRIPLFMSRKKLEKILVKASN